MDLVPPEVLRGAGRVQAQSPWSGVGSGPLLGDHAWHH